MTDDARDAAIGRTVTEYRDKKSRLAALHSELTRAGDALRGLGDALRGRPHLVKFEGASIRLPDVGYQAGRAADVDARYLDLEWLRAQVADYQEIAQEVERLAAQIKEFGLTP